MEINLPKKANREKKPWEKVVSPAIYSLAGKLHYRSLQLLISNLNCLINSEFYFHTGQRLNRNSRSAERELRIQTRNNTESNSNN